MRAPWSRPLRMSYPARMHAATARARSRARAASACHGCDACRRWRCARAPRATRRSHTRAATSSARRTARCVETHPRRSVRICVRNRKARSLSTVRQDSDSSLRFPERPRLQRCLCAHAHSQVGRVGERRRGDRRRKAHSGVMVIGPRPSPSRTRSHWARRQRRHDPRDARIGELVWCTGTRDGD
jgi:hypothetical protein